MKGLLLALCVAFAARAEPANEVRVDLGIASPLGFGGVSYTRTLSDALRLEGGVGFGLSGVQLSVMPRYFVKDFVFVGLGPSFSVRRLDTGDVGGAFRRTGEGVWLNGEVGVRLASSAGVTFSVSGGATVGLWGNYMLREPGVFVHDSYAGLRGFTTAQARVGVGYAF